MTSSERVRQVLDIIDRFEGCKDSDDELAVINTLERWAAEVRELPSAGIDRLLDLRRAGWSVAVHNDYRQDDAPMTFWLLTHPDGRWVKGEGLSDAYALEQAFKAARVE